MISVLLVEDDVDLSEMLSDELRLMGFQVMTARSALESYKQLLDQPPEVVVLDIGLPDESGLEVAKFIRQHTSLGLIMLTALGSDKARIAGYSAGADLYLVKPASAEELKWAIHNLSRRLQEAQGLPAHQAWRFDTIDWALISPTGQRCQLSGKEKQLLELLSTSSSQPTPKTNLLQQLKYTEDEYGLHALETLVLRLRKKIAQRSGSSSPIKTVRGVGYQFTAPLVMEPRPC